MNTAERASSAARARQARISAVALLVGSGGSSDGIHGASHGAGTDAPMSIDASSPAHLLSTGTVSRRTSRRWQGAAAQWLGGPVGHGAGKTP